MSTTSTRRTFIRNCKPIKKGEKLQAWTWVEPQEDGTFLSQHEDVYKLGDGDIYRVRLDDLGLPNCECFIGQYDGGCPHAGSVCDFIYEQQNQVEKQNLAEKKLNDKPITRAQRVLMDQRIKELKIKGYTAAHLSSLLYGVAIGGLTQQQADDIIDRLFRWPNIW